MMPPQYQKYPKKDSKRTKYGPQDGPNICRNRFFVSGPELPSSSFCSQGCLGEVPEPNGSHNGFRVMNKSILVCYGNQLQHLKEMTDYTQQHSQNTCKTNCRNSCRHFAAQQQILCSALQCRFPEALWQFRAAGPLHICTCIYIYIYIYIIHMYPPNASA